MEGPANTLNYFIAGYVVIFGIMAGYVTSLAVRWNNLKQDAAVLEELKEKEGEK
ncbi:MAG: hypothetical protein IT308_09255 [Anaerolineaceae bacterium]|nr:hypothetical protein [Anaerolineaceae bacterium]